MGSWEALDGCGERLTCSNSVDGKTDDIIQRVIREKFSFHTIIAVAHKLDTILDFDKVAMLDGGHLVEFDDPYALLNTPDSAFAELYSSTIAEQAEDVTVEEYDLTTSLVSGSGRGSMRSPRSLTARSFPGSPESS